MSDHTPAAAKTTGATPRTDAGPRAESPSKAGRSGHQGRPAELRSTDPATMRALAHPLRIEIMEIMGDMQEATASELAARLNQSVANCSFHLRILAAGGFIERAEPRGREKPWRLVHESRDLRPAEDDPDSVQESAHLAGLYVQREAARVLRFLREGPSYMSEPTWLGAVTVNTSTFWATPQEMTQLAEDLNSLVDRFEGRKDPANRPDGARKGRLFATVNPDLDDLLAHRTESDGTTVEEPGLIDGD